jgi:hypothetical protein
MRNGVRRRTIADLDGDGADKLCIESVAERGAGLFVVMDLGEVIRSSRRPAATTQAAGNASQRESPGRR